MKRNGWGGDGWGKQGDAARIATALERIAAALETPAPQTFFQNSANPSGVIQTDEDLDIDGVRELKANWDSGHRRSARS